MKEDETVTESVTSAPIFLIRPANREAPVARRCDVVVRYERTPVQLHIIKKTPRWRPHLRDQHHVQIDTNIFTSEASEHLVNPSTIVDVTPEDGRETNLGLADTHLRAGLCWSCRPRPPITEPTNHHLRLLLPEEDATAPCRANPFLKKCTLRKTLGVDRDSSRVLCQIVLS